MRGDGVKGCCFDHDVHDPSCAECQRFDAIKNAPNPPCPKCGEELEYGYGLMGGGMGGYEFCSSENCDYMLKHESQEDKEVREACFGTTS